MSKYARWPIFLAFFALIAALLGLGYYIYAQSLVVVPANGGTYVEAIVGSPIYLNPILCDFNPVDRDLCSLIYDGLTDTNAQGESIPNLAASWDISDDGLSYTFYLREDVYWHDGAPLTVEDVLYTVGAIQDEDYAGPTALAEFWRQITVVPEGMFTVRFDLPAPYGPFLSHTDLGLLPAHLLENVTATQLPMHPLNRAPIGTGSWQFVQQDTGSLTLARYANDFRERSYLDQLRFDFYATPQAALQACQAGKADGVSRVQPQDLPQVWDNKLLRLYSAPLSGLSLVFLNNENVILKELPVRQALWYATDRQALLDDYLNGQGIVANSPIPSFSWAYNAATPDLPYDPDHAADLLNDAGWLPQANNAPRRKGNLPLRFTLTVSDNALQVAMARALAEQWSVVGIEAIIQVSGPLDLANKYLIPRRYEALLYEWQQVPADPDLYAMWHSSQAKRGGQNFAALQDDRIDIALENGRLAHDPAERLRSYDPFQRRFVELAPSLLLYHPVYNYVLSNRVNNVQLGPLLDASDRFRNIREWYVLVDHVPDEHSWVSNAIGRN